MKLNELKNQLKHLCEIGKDNKEEGLKECNILLESYEEDFIKGIITYYKGLIYESFYELDNALQSYETAVHLGVTIDSLVRIYSIYQKENNLVYALETIDKMIELEPQIFYGYDLKFNFLFNLKAYEEAEKLLLLTEKVFEKNSIITLNKVRVNSALGRFTESLRIIESEENNKEIYDDLLIEKARIKVMQGSVEESITILKDVQAKYENNIDIIYLLGSVLMMSGKLKEANECLAKLIEIDYKEDYTYLIGLYYYGITLKSFKDKEEVKEYFKWLKRKYSIYALNNPKDLNVKIFNGIIQYELENYREALEIIKSLEEVSGEIIEVYFFKALIYKALVENDKYEGLKVILEEKNMMFFKILESMESLEE